MSKSKSQQAKANFGEALRSGLASRGGANLPAQSTAAPPPDQTPAERLEGLEQRIQASLASYQVGLRTLQMRHRAEVGELLGQINGPDELFRAAGYERFGDYVKARWGWDRSYGYRLIDLAVVRRALAPLGQAAVDDVAESHARELAPVVRYQDDEAARDLVSTLRAESGGRRVTAAVIRARRDAAGLGAPSLGDEAAGTDEVVTAELVDDEAAEAVNREVRAAAAAAERAVHHLDEALRLDEAPFHAHEAAQNTSRLRTAVVRIQRRLGALPGA
ncbi:hypothetical protein ACIQU6_43005 [Streptomyces sp. NPDC090442]|uniref:hypothetical protein n=1 Tax=Streptomyces sp. NPDC090442 TaxID=3365962 RepID=UPI003801A10E